MIDSHAAPLSLRGRIPNSGALKFVSGVVDLLKKLNAAPTKYFGTHGRQRLSRLRRLSRDAGHPGGQVHHGFVRRGKVVGGDSWAGSAEGVADEAPQHGVSLPSFAMGMYDVTRGEYAAFVRETGHSSGDGCGIDGFEWKKLADKSWQNPGYAQTYRDPVVCVSWQDAKSYIAWLNGKVQQKHSTSGDGPQYRLPSEIGVGGMQRAPGPTRDSGGATMTQRRQIAPGTRPIRMGRTHPVGLKQANAFGLYDMAGNVWQWTEDCYDNTYVPRSRKDGRANETPSGRRPRARWSRQVPSRGSRSMVCVSDMGSALRHARKKSIRLSRHSHGIPE